MAVRCRSRCCLTSFSAASIHPSAKQHLRLIRCSATPVQARTVRVKKYAFQCIKVYEDASRGIVCYKNKLGELICEGYDEGPRYSPIQEQGQQYWCDSSLYLCTMNIMPYLIEGRDYVLKAPE